MRQIYTINKTILKKTEEKKLEKMYCFILSS